jgi:hypothetical protein
MLWLLVMGVSLPFAHAQQPANAEPQTPSSTVQTAREVIPALPVPRLVKFAGAFKDELGKPRTGVVGVTFALYKDQEGGAALWLETQNVELDEQGHYTVLLGSTKSEGLPLEMFSSGEPRWLGVQVNLPHEAEQPRVLLVSVPYALKAADADTLGGKPLSSFVLADAASGGGGRVGAVLPTAGPIGAATIGGGGSPSVVTKFDATGANVINSSISDNGSRINVGEGIDFSSDFSFVGNAEPTATGRVQMFDRANVGFVIRGLNVLFETLQGTPTNILPVEAMRVTPSGNVGIGTPSPSQKMEVAGNLKLSGAGNAIIFPNGTVMSSAAMGVGGGTITGVTAGTGLSGGGNAGGVTLHNTGVLSFNGRPGTVIPAMGDYSFSQISGAAVSAQLPSASLVRAITYLAGCDNCSVLTNADSQSTIFQNLIGAMTVNSVTCFSDAGSPAINIQVNHGGSLSNVLSSNLACSTSGATSTSFSTSALSVNDILNFTLVADGVAKRVTLSIKATVN